MISGFFSQWNVVFLRIGSVMTSSAGNTSRITAILMSAPRLMSLHNTPISSIRETRDTLNVAAKKVRPLVKML